MSIDWTKPLRTVKEHYPCRVLATDLKGNYPMAVLIPCGDEEIIFRLTTDGRVYLGHISPYVENIPEEKFVWVNVYENSDGVLNTGVPQNSEKEALDSVICCEYYGQKLVGRNKFKLERRFDE